MNKKIKLFGLTNAVMHPKWKKEKQISSQRVRKEQSDLDLHYLIRITFHNVHKVVCSFSISNVAFKLT